MGDRRYLHMDHRWRMKKRAFDGTQKLDGAPIVPNGEDILRKLDVLFECGDNNARIEKRQKIAHDVVDTNVDIGLKKKSIFFTLPYWKDNLLQYNLDVMHIEKNVIDNILGTLLDITGRQRTTIKPIRI
jgi:hypothetical protein